MVCLIIVSAPGPDLSKGQVSYIKLCDASVKARARELDNIKA